MAVGYDGTRTKIYEKVNIQKTLEAGKYYSITSLGKGNTLSCGTGTSIDSNGKISWSFSRGDTKSGIKADQIWQWESRDGAFYLYNPQSGHYFGGTANSQTTALYPQAKAQAWEAVCIDETKGQYTFNIKGTGNYMNSYSDVNTGLWTGGASDNNNIWKVQEVKSIKISIPASLYYAACYPFALELPEGVTAYVVSQTATDTYEGTDYKYAVLDSIAAGIIPAGMPVILHGAKATYSFNLVPNDSTTIEATNLLKGTTIKHLLAKESFLATIVETNNAGTTAIIKGNTTGTQVAANKSYLMREDIGNAEELYLAKRSNLTSIENIEEDSTPEILYTLDGKKAEKVESGKIYITSKGKKIYIK